MSSKKPTKVREKALGRAGWVIAARPAICPFDSSCCRGWWAAIAEKMVFSLRHYEKALQLGPISWRDDHGMTAGVRQTAIERWIAT